MNTTADFIAELRGAGIDQKEVIDIHSELTRFAISRDKLLERLAVWEDEEELQHILMTVKAASAQEVMWSDMLWSLSPREKQCYLMHTVDGMSLTDIAKELGFTPSSSKSFVNRAMKKIEIIKSVGIQNPTPGNLAMAKLYKNLSPREKQCYWMNTVYNKSMNSIGEELGISKSNVQDAIKRARKKIEELK